MANINWFPGHMTKTIRNIESKIKLIDIIIEVIDARAPLSSSNPILNNFKKDKIIILNKKDLADNNITEKWINYFFDKKINFIVSDINNNNFKKKLIKKIQEVLKYKIDKYKIKGLINYQIRVMILGIPNVGKSTIINKLSKNKKVKTGNKPGLTRGEQWIKIENNIFLLDTPGILWPKFSSEEIGINLSLIGSIKHDVLNKSDIISYAIDYLNENYFDILNKKYLKLDEKIQIIPKNSYEYIEILSKKYKLNNIAAIDKLFYDLINNKVGKISWEKPNEK